MPELPPVVAEITLNYEAFAAGIDECKGQMAGLTGTLDEATGEIDDTAGSASAAADSMERLGGSADTASAGLDTVAGAGDVASASMARVAEASDAASASSDRMVAASDASRASMAEVAGGAAMMGSGVKGAADDIKDAEDDAEDHSSGFSSRVASMFQRTGAVMGNFGIPFHEGVSKMGDDIDEAGVEGDGFMASMAGIGKVATVVGGVALAGLAAESAHLADQFDVAQTRLQVAIKNSGDSFDAFRPKVQSTYATMADLGFNDKEVASSLAVLTTATKSPTTAMGDMSLAANLARTRSISLESATGMLAKAYAGSNRAITQMGINLNVGTAKLHSVQAASESVAKAQTSLKTTQDEVNAGTIKGSVAADKLKSAHEALSSAELKLKQDQDAVGTVMNALTERTKGAAQAFSGTLAGSIDSVRSNVHNLEVSFGELLLPVLAKVASVVATVVEWLAHNKQAALALAAVIAGPLIAAIAVFIGGMIAANAATLGIGAAVALIIVGLVELITHFGAVTDFIKNHALIIALALLPITAGLSLVVYAAYEMRGTIATVFGAIVSIVETAWGVVKTVTETVIDAVKTIVETTWSVIRTVTETTWNTIKAVIEAVWGTIRSIVTTAVDAVKAVLEAGWNLIRSVTQSAWDAVRSAIEGAWGAIRSVVSGALSGIEGALSGAWATIQGGVSSAWAAIKGAVASAWSGIGGAVQSGIGTVVGFVSSLPGKIVGALGGLVGDMERVGAEAIHALLSGLESAAGSVAGEVGHVLSEINPLSHVSLPHLAEGGIVSKPTLALIGEAGDEAVIPLNQLGGAGALAGGGVSPLPSGGPAAHAATTGAPVFNTTIYSQGQPTSTLISELYLRLRPMLQGA